MGYDSAKLSQLFESRSFFGNITPNFKWNILNYGRIANNVRLQEAKTQELVDTYQNLVLTAAQQVETAIRGFLRSREQAEILARSAAAAFEATKVEEKIFSERKADVNRMYTLWSALLQEQDNLAIAQGNVALNLINVYRALAAAGKFKRTKKKDEKRRNCRRLKSFRGLKNCKSTPQRLEPSFPDHHSITFQIQFQILRSQATLEFGTCYLVSDPG